MDASLARRLVLVAIALGALADVLFDGQRPGLNAAIGTAVLLAAITVIGRRHSTAPIDRADVWLPPVALAAAAALALRADPSLVLLDALLVLAALGAWSFAAAGTPVTRRSTASVAALGGWVVAAAGLAAFAVARRLGLAPSLDRAAEALRRVAPVVRGLVLALPIVVLFSALLASADAVFGRVLEDALAIPIHPEEPLRHAALIAVVAWLVLGPLAIAAGILPPAGVELGPGGPATEPRRSFAATELTVVLLALDALFGVFVALQFAYLFGGGDTRSAIGPTYSEYARQGYFQLVAVVVLVGLLILVATALASRTCAFEAVTLALIALTAVILASAVVRLGLYLQAYGWTELRFYVGASMAWLAICGVTAAVLFVRDGMRWLPHAAALAAIAVTLAISALGPQAFVAGQNVARAIDPSLVPADGHDGLDAAYLASLGPDAVPVIVDALDRMSTTDRKASLQALEPWRTATDVGPTDWREWNLARARAAEALERLAEDERRR